MSLIDYAAIQPPRKAKALPLSARATFFYGSLVLSTTRPAWYRGANAGTDGADKSSVYAAAQALLDGNLISHALWDYNYTIADQNQWRSSFGQRIAMSSVINGYSSAGGIAGGNLTFTCVDPYGAAARPGPSNNGYMTAGTTAGKAALLGGSLASAGFTGAGVAWGLSRPDLWSVLHHDDPAYQTEGAYYGGDMAAETVAGFQTIFAGFATGYADMKAYALSYGSLSAWTTRYRANRANPATVEGQWYIYSQKISRDFYVNQLIPAVNGTMTLTANIYAATPTDEMAAWMWSYIDQGFCEPLFNQAVQHVFAARMHECYGNGSISITMPTRQTFTWDGINPYANKWLDRKEWATATVYAVGDLVVAHPSSTTTNAFPNSARTMYEVMTAHTSGDFSADLTAVRIRKVRVTPIRQTIAASYAAGSNPTHPWSTYLGVSTDSADGSAPFFFCQQSDYADLFGFVARNKHLFDDARNPPAVALVVPFMQRYLYTNCKSLHPNCNAFDLYAYTETLCAAGVPFAIETVGGTLEPRPVPARLRKYAAVIKGSNSDADFGANLPTAAASSVPVFTRTEFSALAAQYSVASVTGATGTVWIIPRVNVNDKRVLIHVIPFAWTESTDTPTTQTGVDLNITPLGVLSNAPKFARWNTPKASSRLLVPVESGGGLKVRLPSFDDWGILELQF